MKIVVCVFLVLLFAGCGDKKSTENSNNTTNPASATPTSPTNPSTTSPAPSLDTPTPPSEGPSPAPTPSPSPGPAPTPSPTTGTIDANIDYYKGIVMPLTPAVSTTTSNCIFYPLNLIASSNVKYLSADGNYQYDLRFDLILFDNGRYVLAYQPRDGNFGNWFSPTFFQSTWTKGSGNLFKLDAIADGTITLVQGAPYDRVVNLKFYNNTFQNMTLANNYKADLAILQKYEQSCVPAIFSKNMSNFANILYGLLEPTTY